jgi:hypothetical protein
MSDPNGAGLAEVRGFRWRRNQGTYGLNTLGLVALGAIALLIGLRSRRK